MPKPLIPTKSYANNQRWRRKRQPTPVFLPGESRDRGAWQATVSGVARVGHDLATKLPIIRESCLVYFQSVQFSSVAQSCPTLCDPINCSKSGLPVHHQLPKFTQTHVCSVGDAIQPSHSLSSPSPFSNESALHMRWPKYWSFSFNISPSVTRVYVPRLFVSSQQRFGVTDIKAPSACHNSQVLDRPYYSSQVSNGPCYSS